MIISVQSKKRGKEGTKTQASDWPTDSGADILNREVFKETKLITKNVTSWLAQYTTICIHVSNLLILVSRQAKQKGERNSVFTFQFHAMHFFFVQGMQQFLLLLQRCFQCTIMQLYQDWSRRQHIWYICCNHLYLHGYFIFTSRLECQFANTLYWFFLN